MQVKLFSAAFRPDTPEAQAFELEINNWLENQDIDILSMTVSSSERDTYLSMVFFVVYEELEDDDEGDGLEVTIPQITVREIPPLTPRMRRT